MGRALIISGGDNGLYDASVKYDSRNADKVIAAIDRDLAQISADLAAIVPKLAECDQKITELQPELNDARDTYHAEIARAFATEPEKVTHPEANPTGEDEDGWMESGSLPWGPLPDGYWDAYLEILPPEPITEFSLIGYKLVGSAPDNKQKQELMDRLKSTPSPDDKKLRDAFAEVLKVLSQIKVWLDRKTAIEKDRSLLLFRQKQLEKRKAALTSATADGAAQSMWCADLTEDLTGEVDTLEVIGAPAQILVQPGGTSNLLDDSGTAGKLSNIMQMSPAGAGFAWALLPGWQKWRPTYRVGTIHSIDYEADTASVNLDTSESVAQDLNINQAETLEAIPVEYMDCNADAFLDGDRVVVEFPGQLWGQGPKVIGFETNPQACPGYSAIVGSTSEFAAFNDDNIFEWRPGDASDTSPAIETATLVSPVPENTEDWNNAWKKGSTVKLGVSWKYPWDFADGKQFTMRIKFNIVIRYAEGGTTIIPCELRYASPAFTAKDKTAGRAGGGLFTCSYRIPTFSGPGYSDDATCHPTLWLFDPTPVAFVISQWQYYYRVSYLNEIPSYNLTYSKIFYTWVHELYADGGYYLGTWYPGADVHAGDTAYSLTGCDPCPPTTCADPGIKCPTGEDIPVGDYLDVADPCDSAADKAQLYIEQSWSMAGTIGDDGVTLDDSTAGLTMGEHTVPFGPFDALNATLGEISLTALGPVSGVHHVGWSVTSINTAASTVAAIGEQSWGGSSWGSISVCTREAGHVKFYGIVEKKRQE